MKLVCTRSRLIEDLCPAGKMCALFASRDEVDRAILTLSAEDQVKVVVAGVNGPTQTVISGEAELVSSIARKIGAKSQMLDSKHAMHSPLMEPCLEELRKHLRDYNFQCPRIDMVSILTGKLETCLDSAYWLRHEEPRPMLFQAAMETLVQELECSAFLEIGPRPVLVKMGRRCVGDLGQPLEWTATFDDDFPEMLSVKKACLAVRGGRAEPVHFNRQLFFWRRVAHPMLGAELLRARTTVEFESTITPARIGFYADHVVNGEIWSPGASQLLLMGAAAMVMEQPNRASSGFEPGTMVELADVVFPRPLRLSGEMKVRNSMSI